MEPGYLLAVCVGCFSIGHIEPLIRGRPETPQDFTQCFTGEIWKHRQSEDQRIKRAVPVEVISNKGIGASCGGDFKVKSCPGDLVCVPKHPWSSGMGTSGTCQKPDPGKPSSPTPPFPAKGAQLLPPIKEPPTIAFNGTTRFAGKSKGLVWDLKSLSEVISPAAGHVVHAGDFRGYGNLIIINAGSGYQLLIAGLSTLAVKQGDHVTEGALLGMTRKAGTPTGVNSAVANPVIYFELRKDGRPIDPKPWMYPNK